MKQFFVNLFRKKSRPKSSNLILETADGRYFHEHKVKAILNTIINCTIEDASSVIQAIANAENIKLHE